MKTSPSPSPDYLTLTPGASTVSPHVSFQIKSGHMLRQIFKLFTDKSGLEQKLLKVLKPYYYTLYQELTGIFPKINYIRLVVILNKSIYLIFLCTLLLENRYSLIISNKLTAWKLRFWHFVHLLQLKVLFPNRDQPKQFQNECSIFMALIVLQRTSVTAMRGFVLKQLIACSLLTVQDAGALGLAVVGLIDLKQLTFTFNICTLEIPISFFLIVAISFISICWLSPVCLALF